MAPNLVADGNVMLVEAELESKKQPTWSESLHDSVNVFSFDAVDDVVAASGDKMTASHNFNFRLGQAQHGSIDGTIHKAILLCPEIPRLMHHASLEDRTH